MQTHDDDDSNSPLSALRKKAEEMTARGENLLTAGAPAERALLDVQVGGFMVRQLPDDPFALRISIGEAPNKRLFESAYLVYRGDRRAIEALLVRALNALRAVPHR